MTSTTAPPARRPYRPVSLENLSSISSGEYAAARTVIARVQALIDWRDRHAANLDPAADFPAGNWRRDHEDNDFMDAVRLIAAGDYAAINHLRYYTNTLVGAKLLYFCPNPGMSSIMPLPANPRAVVADNLHRLDSMIGEYQRIKPAFPARLLIKPPWKLAEVVARVDGVIVNQDTVRQQATIATMWRSGAAELSEGQDCPERDRSRGRNWRRPRQPVPPSQTHLAETHIHHHRPARDADVFGGLPIHHRPKWAADDSRPRPARPASRSASTWRRTTSLPRFSPGCPPSIWPSTSPRSGR